MESPLKTWKPCACVCVCVFSCGQTFPRYRSIFVVFSHFCFFHGGSLFLQRINPCHYAVSEWNGTSMCKTSEDEYALMLMINDVACADSKREARILPRAWSHWKVSKKKKTLMKTSSFFPHFSKLFSCSHPEGCCGFGNERQNEGKE